MGNRNIDRNDLLWGITAILLIVNVLLLGIIGASSLDRDDTNPNIASASFTSDFESNGSDSVITMHNGGDDLKADNVTIIIDGAINGMTEKPYSEINGHHNVTSLGYTPGSYLEPDDTIVLNRSTLGVADEIDFESAEIRLTYQMEKSINTYYKWTGPDEQPTQTTSRSSS